MVEKKGWEVSWAKPIGASKYVERQRHIREAVARSDALNAVEESFSKQSESKKRGAKALAKARNDESVYIAQMKVLQNFVKDRFNAMCDFNCAQIQGTNKYVCTVSTPCSPAFVC